MSHLGLPLEYQGMPEYFDVTNESAEEKNAVIAGILKANNVKTVLDLTCGTGSQVFFLDKEEFDVVGADFSPHLLCLARERAIRENRTITFIDGDMRDLHVGSFDAVITIFNAIGHLSKTDFEEAMRNISRNLKQGGLYVFDIFNLDALNDETLHHFDCYKHQKTDETIFHTAQCSTLEYATGILTSYDIYMIQKKAEKPERFHHEFSLQIYNEKELRNMLEHNGFEVIQQCDMNGSHFIKNKTINMLTVARKKS